MKTEQLELDRYDSRYIETFLRSYERLVGSAQELTTEWPDMDEEERDFQRSSVIPNWEKRYLLGALYRAGRLTSDQAARLADLDRALLEEAGNVEIAYGPPLGRLVEDLLDWGTPLTEADGTVRLEVPLRTLPALARALADDVVSRTELEAATS